MSCFKRIMYMDYGCADKEIRNVGFVRWMKRKEIGDSRAVEDDCFQIHLSREVCDGDVRGTMAIVDDLYCEEYSVKGSVLLGEVILESGQGSICVRNVSAVIKEKEIYGSGSKWLRLKWDADKFVYCMLEDEKGDTGMKSEKVEPEEVLGVELEISAAERMMESHEIPKQGYCVEQMHRDKWSQVWEMGNHIHPFEDEREYLQIELKSLVVLAQQYYPLVENSFLLHGYHNYGHLAMVKMIRQGRERICLGVPGTYYKREAEVAVMFGFESFESKEEPPKEGDFGYYFISVGI